MNTLITFRTSFFSTGKYTYLFILNNLNSFWVESLWCNNIRDLILFTRGLGKYFEIEPFKNKIQANQYFQIKSSKGESETLALESYLKPPGVISSSAQLVLK